MACLSLKDSDLKGTEEGERKTLSLFIHAISDLYKSIIKPISLSGQSSKEIYGRDIISYEISQTGECRSNALPEKVIFYTSHYIGTFTTVISGNPVSIKITPRFGSDSAFFNYLLTYAYGLYLPNSGTASASNNASGTDNQWLIALLWKACLEKSITNNQIPKSYETIERNSSAFKGRLHLTKHLRHNLVDQSRFYCVERKLTMNTPINRAIRAAYHQLTSGNCKEIVKGLKSYNDKLESFGVSKDITVSEIANIHYSRLNIGYKPTVELCKTILQQKSFDSVSNQGQRKSFSYFIDLAELWESYLLKLLQRHLQDYRVYSPNVTGGDFLIENRMRSIRPDIIIRNRHTDQIVAILDAKYKNYTQLGRSVNEYSSVSREDLYQMCTYLYHYGKEGSEIVGLFITPQATNDKTHSFIAQGKHRIGVLGLNIRQFEREDDEKEVFERNAFHKEEEAFIEEIKAILEKNLSKNHGDLMSTGES